MNKFDMYNLFAATRAETGVDFAVPGGVVRWRRAIAPTVPGGAVEKYRGLSPRAWRERFLHVLHVEQLEDPESRFKQDPRIIYAGRSIPGMSPERWGRAVAGEFASFWRAICRRPNTVGSSYNPLTPVQALGAWLAGVPDALVRRHGKRLLNRHGECRMPTARRLRTLERARRAGLRGTAKIVSKDIPTKTLAALGRLSPEAQAQALSGCQVYREDGSPLRVRDLNWAAVAAFQKRLTAAKTPAAQLRTRVLAHSADNARRLLRLCRNSYGPCGNEPCRNCRAALVAYYTPQYPLADLLTAYGIAVGVATPESLGEGLTSKEAHRWLVETGGVDTPAGWLAGQLIPGTATTYGTPRYVAVIRWLADVDADPTRREALLREREFPGPGGQLCRGRYADRLDELIPADLQKSVDGTFRTAAERYTEAALARLAEQHTVLAAFPASWPKLPRFAQALVTNAQLVAEGRDLAHCVGGYGPMVKEGKSVIVSIRSRHGRSTVEINPVSGRVAQHRGPNNGAPPVRHADWLRAYVARIPRGHRQSRYD